MQTFFLWNSGKIQQWMPSTTCKKKYDNYLLVFNQILYDHQQLNLAYRSIQAFKSPFIYVIHEFPYCTEKETPEQYTLLEHCFETICCRFGDYTLYSSDFLSFWTPTRNSFVRTSMFFHQSIRKLFVTTDVVHAILFVHPDLP